MHTVLVVMLDWVRLVYLIAKFMQYLKAKHSHFTHLANAKRKFQSILTAIS